MRAKIATIPDGTYHGQAGGAVFIATMKSGTNKYHGRDSSFSAMM